MNQALRKLLADPTAILIMVGYADKQGEEAKNWKSPEAGRRAW